MTQFNLPLEQILSREPLIVDLGAGTNARKKRIQGRVTLDILNLPEVDIVTDLNDGLPFFPDNSVDEIFSNNTLEHISNLPLLMKEIHRVLRPGGKKVLFVPHFSNPYYYSDPTHHSYFGLYTFYYFSTSQDHLHRRVPTFYFESDFVVEHLRLRFISPFGPVNKLYRLIDWAVNFSHLTQEIYEHSFCYFIPCYGIEVTLRPVKDIKH